MARKRSGWPAKACLFRSVRPRALSVGGKKEILHQQRAYSESKSASSPALLGHFLGLFDWQSSSKTDFGYRNEGEGAGVGEEGAGDKDDES